MGVCRARYARQRIPLSLHPDCNRRPWDLTKSADLAHLKSQRKQALVGYAFYSAITTGGESRPALRTSPILLSIGAVRFTTYCTTLHGQLGILPDKLVQAPSQT